MHHVLVNLKKLLVDDGDMELVGGDDQGQGTAINDELHCQSKGWFPQFLSVCQLHIL